MRVIGRPKLGGEQWTIYEVASTNQHLLSDECCFNGRCDYNACKIYINKNLDSSAKAHAILHELVHALLHVTGAMNVYGADPKLDEDLVSALTPALHRLLGDYGFHFPGLYN